MNETCILEAFFVLSILANLGLLTGHILSTRMKERRPLLA